MNRVGRLLICIAGALTLSVSSRADSPVSPTPNVDALRLKAMMNRTNMMNRLLMMKQQHRHGQNMPGFPQFPRPNTPQTPQLNVALPKAGDSVAASVPAKSDAVSSDNPYQSIVTRNVFGLNPIPVGPPVNQQPGPPPPKITLTGITTIFGPAEALFRVAGVVRNGKPPHDESYIFTEGEEEDDVEVKAIDTQKNMVKFINHGVEQELSLSDATASGPAPAPTFPGQMHRFGFRGFPNPGGGDNVVHPAFSGYRNAKVLQNLSGDDQAALIAAQHAQWQQDGNPAANLFPPTRYDNDAGVTPPGGGGEAGGPPTPPQ